MPSEHADARPMPEQQDREGEQHVDQARERRCRPSRGSSRRSCRSTTPISDRDRRRDDRHRERHPGAVEDPREHVAAELVDAERVLAARAGRGSELVERLGVLVVRARSSPTRLTISGAKIAARTSSTMKTRGRRARPCPACSRRQKSCERRARRDLGGRAAGLELLPLASRMVDGAAGSSLRSPERN